MSISVRAASLAEIQPLRDVYRHEMRCQIIHDSLHVRPGWTQSYLITIDDAPAGHGAVTFGGPWKDRPTIFEFFVLPPHRLRTFALFAAFVQACGTRHVETQTNGTVLGVLAQSFCESVSAEAILYEDRFTTSVRLPGAIVRNVTPQDASAIAAAKLDADADWLVELDGSVVATGGILFHYNRPYGDLYMSVAEAHRRRGIGAYLVQELKRICYEGGSVPAARCNVANAASRATLQKAGFVPCGNIINGTLSDRLMPAQT